MSLLLPGQRHQVAGCHQGRRGGGVAGQRRGQVHTRGRLHTLPHAGQGCQAGTTGSGCQAGMNVTGIVGLEEGILCILRALLFLLLLPGVGARRRHGAGCGRGHVWEGRIVGVPMRHMPDVLP